MPPHTTTRKTTTNLKTNNTQNCLQIELYGSPTTKDSKKPHTFRRVGGVEMWSQGGAVRRCGVVQRGSGGGGSGMGGPTFMWGE